MTIVVQSTLLDPEVLANDVSVIFVLDRELKITGCNEAWDRFALENQGGADVLAARQTGRPVFDVVPDALREFYRALYEETRTSGKPVSHEYECSTADRFRLYQMRLLPLSDSGEIVVVNSSVIQQEHSNTPLDGGLTYVGENGFLVMCAHCRRTRRAADNTWDWVPDYVSSMPKTVSHALCPICFEYHYSPQRRNRKRV